MLIALLFVLGASRPASAQQRWTENSAYRVWSSYNADFYTGYNKSTSNSSGYVFAAQQGGSTMTGFWEEAEEIELAGMFDIPRRRAAP